MKELLFLGNGGPFNYEKDNTSAFYLDEKTMYLFDCGEKIASKIIHYQLLDNLENLVIIITHLHSDHVSSLEPLLTYLKLFKQGIKVTVIYPNEEKLKQLLSAYSFNDDVTIISKMINNTVSIYPYKTTHIGEAYSYYFLTKDLKFYYSGDTSAVNKDAVNKLEKGEINYLYHEVALFKSAVHTDLDTLSDMIDSSIRHKVYLMHFSDEKTVLESQKRGFNISPLYKK